MSSTKDDEQVALDLQLAYELQVKEERAVQRRMKKSSENYVHEDGFSVNNLNADHMLFVDCFIDGRAVNMLVDSGASASAISSQMVRRLGLSNKLNPNITGDANGVGSSTIVGVIENVECIIGDVEFRLFFVVLDGDWPYIIFGLDQMRRFKCLIDLENEALVFGGRDGLNVPFLSKDAAQYVAAQFISRNAGGEQGWRARDEPRKSTTDASITFWTKIEFTRNSSLSFYFSTLLDRF